MIHDTLQRGDLFAAATGSVNPELEPRSDSTKGRCGAEWGDFENIPERQTLNELHLFAGAGGGILGGLLCGHTCVCAVEIEPYARQVLLARQRDGHLPRFPIWDDVRTFDGKPWAGIVDVVCGGFPCQDISTAGRGVGLGGERSGLWKEMLRIVCEIRPGFVFVENSPALTFRGLGDVLGDLACVGYDARWGVFSAADVGARHQRDRVWIVAHRDEIRLGIPAQYRAEQHPELLGEDARFRESEGWRFVGDCAAGADDNLESVLLRKSDVLANQVDRVAAIGNGQVPAVVAFAWRILTGGGGAELGANVIERESESGAGSQNQLLSEPREIKT